MHVQIVATAPTFYQTNSLRALCGGTWYKANPDGSFQFNFEFMTKREALQWLIDRAERLAYDSVELKEMISEVKNYGQLTYDCITARIQKNK